MTNASYNATITYDLPDNGSETVRARLTALGQSGVDEVFPQKADYDTVLDANGEGTDTLPTPDNDGTLSWVYEIIVIDSSSNETILGHISFAYNASAQELGTLLAAEATSHTSSDVSTLIANKVSKTGDTMSGTLAMADNLITRPKIEDYGETVNAIGSIGGGTQDIDLESGNVVTGTVDTSTTTFTFSNPPASGTAGSFTLFLTNGGSQTVNWPASVDWAGGTAPTLTTSGVDVLTFVTVDGGTIWYGFAAGLDMQ